MPRRTILRSAIAVTTAALVTGTLSAGAHATPTTDPSGGHYTTKTPTSVGFGGAVSSVDPEASRIGLQVLKDGGNAVDAAVATAGALGVTEPYSSGLGGGGFFVYYDAKTGQVHTIDGRETAPASMPHNAFIDPSTGQPYNFTPQLVTSGVSVGVPGTPATWQTALDRWGTRSLGQTLAPAEDLAERGFVVDDTFHLQTEENKQRFEAYTTTPKLYLPNGDAPAVGSVLTNPDLAQTYRELGKHGMGWFYNGPIGQEISAAVQHPPKSPTTNLPVMPGYMQPSDVRDYSTILRQPTHVNYRGYDVYGMPPSSSGGSTVGEALNILGQYDLAKMTPAAQLHHYLEASALAFADRAKYVGDPGYVHVPLSDLLSKKYAAERACQISETTAMTKPVAPGDVSSYDGRCGTASSSTANRKPDTENVETTNMTVADKWGNIVEYTLTIEQTGGSGMLLAHRGFILNNELTDFTAAYDPNDPNRIEGGKRPRSSISPTVILDNGKPFVALGSPGGSTIITTVLQMIFNRIDRGMSLPQAIAEPRASQRNTPSVTAEQSFIDEYGDLLKPYGHTFTPAGAPGTSAAEIGAATAIEFGKNGLLTAVSEPTRRGGGSALVVQPRG
ncbi:MAG: gamma-glutamyltransferase [Nocardioidaceae bacterium]